MKVRIGGRIIDANEEPVVLIFRDDNERILVGGHITSMSPKQGVRAYGTFPDSAVDIDKHMDDSVKMSGYVE